MAVFDFKDASFSGDRNWSRSSPRFASRAAYVVLALLVLCIVEVILGIVWIVTIQSRTSNLTFPQVLQPLIVPALSFFNTIPSLHLHVLARSNTPALAISFSSILAAIFLISAITFIPPCTSGWSDRVDPPGTHSSTYKMTECPNGSNKGVWAAMVVLQFISALGYAVHMAMAIRVHRISKQRAQDERDGKVMVVIDPEEKARREEEARKRWREIRDL